MRASIRLLSLAAASSIVWLAAAFPAAGDEAPWAVSVYIQESFPKQTRTNHQIEQINAAFGSDFETWDDVHNLSLGAKVFRRVAPRWLVGVEVDWSAGEIAGEETVETLAGPAELAFEQRYSVFANAMAAAHFLPCPDCRRVEPFLLGGLGVAYEKDRTTLTLRNEYLDEGLFVDNDGWFPVATAGVGIEVPLSARRVWFLEAGVAYYWGRLEHHVPATGSLAPAPEVLADTDSTGPNYWLGLHWRFGAPAK